MTIDVGNDARDFNAAVYLPVYVSTREIVDWLVQSNWTPYGVTLDAAAKGTAPNCSTTAHAAHAYC